MIPTWISFSTQGGWQTSPDSSTYCSIAASSSGYAVFSSTWFGNKSDTSDMNSGSSSSAIRESQWILTWKWRMNISMRWKEYVASIMKIAAILYVLDISQPRAVIICLSSICIFCKSTGDGFCSGAVEVFCSSWMWCCILGWRVPNILRQCISLIFEGWNIEDEISVLFLNVRWQSPSDPAPCPSRMENTTWVELR